MKEAGIQCNFKTKQNKINLTTIMHIHPTTFSRKKHFSEMLNLSESLISPLVSLVCKAETRLAKILIQIIHFFVESAIFWENQLVHALLQVEYYFGDNYDTSHLNKR